MLQGRDTSVSPLRSDAMYDSRIPTTHSAASAHAANPPQPGIDPSLGTADLQDLQVRSSGAAPVRMPTEAAVERPVLREAVRQVVTETVMRQANARVASARHGASSAALVPEEPTEAPSGELVRRLAHLRSTLTRYVSERRDAGIPVERVLPEVKALVREAATAEPWSDPADALMGQVVRWTITAYYDQPELDHVPRFY
jgi:hypothetical protein